MARGQLFVASSPIIKKETNATVRVLILELVKDSFANLKLTH